jgi:hypothetical protein
MDSIPRNKNIDSIHEFAFNSPHLKVLGSTSGGYEIRYSQGRGKELIRDLVEKNNVQFENNSRIEYSEHRVVLILPKDWSDKF